MGEDIEGGADVAADVHRRFALSLEHVVGVVAVQVLGVDGVE